MVARAPRKRMYRTMQGRMVDIEKLRAANENVQAIGNMNVNARGDVLGPGGQIVTKKETVIQKYYEQPKGKVDDTPARDRPQPIVKTPPPQSKIQKMTPVAKKPAPQKKVVTKVEQAPKVTKTSQEAPKQGIDAALDGLE